MNYVLDASSLLRLVDDEAGADRVEDLLNQARAGKTELLLSAVNWGEIVYILARPHISSRSRQMIDRLRGLPFRIVDVAGSSAEEAAWFKERFQVPYADAFAGALAYSQNITLITADYDFKPASSAMKVEFLPVK
ncbi:MAG: PIN domain-containing protein [Candidatus Korobacteraceae bacterium]